MIRLPSAPARRLPALLAVVVLVGGLLGGCGGSKTESPKATPAERLSNAQKYLDASKGVTIDLATPELPDGVQGILSAKGIGTRDPLAFDGTIRVVQSGLSVEVPVIAVDGKVYIQFGGSWQDIKPSDFNAPDPASLFKEGSGLSSLLTDVKGIEKGKDVRDGKDVLSTITGTLSGDKVKALIPSATADDFAVTYTLDQDDHLVKAKLAGPFFAKSKDVTYTLGFSDYGTTKKITAP